MAIFLAIPILGLMVILQSAIFSQIHLLNGTLDLVLLALIAWSVQERVTTTWHWSIIAGLLASFATALPAPAVVLAYVSAAAIARFMQRIFWQRPLLAMVTATFLATLATQAITMATLIIGGTSLPLLETFYLITVPSALLNLLLAVPFYALINDIAEWLYPETIEI